MGVFAVVSDAYVQGRASTRVCVARIVQCVAVRRKDRLSVAFLSHDFPPWTAVYQQARRWKDARPFEAAAQDLHELIRLASDRGPQQTAVIMDGRVLQSMPESGSRAG
jgi:transposase